MAESTSFASGIVSFLSQWPVALPRLEDMGGDAGRVLYDQAPPEYLIALAGIYGGEVLSELAGEADQDGGIRLDMLTKTWAKDVGVTLAPYGGGIPVLEGSSMSLEEHVLYGSSRLGVTRYWPGQHMASWDGSGVPTDTARLLKRQSWYSYALNAPMQKDSTQPYGSLNTQPGEAYSRIGLKGYELTNHLGNVQVVVSDKRHVKVDVPEGGGPVTVRPGYLPVLGAAYDYYPFGMLMPGRSVADISEQSAWVNQIVKVAVATEKPMPRFTLDWTAENTTTLLAGNSLSVQGAAGIPAWAYNTNTPYPIRIYRTLLTLPGQPMKIRAIMNISSTFGAGFLYAEEQIGGGSWQQVGVGQFVGGGLGGSLNIAHIENVLTFTPSGSSVRLCMSTQGTHFLLDSMYMSGYRMEDQPMLVKVTNGKAKDAYLYGFNGQEKVNEIAGVGNHTTAQFWEYDTRLGRRWNIDPVVKPWRSSYDALDNNPIWKVDPKGDDEYYNSKAEWIGSNGNHNNVRVMLLDNKQVKNIVSSFTKKGLDYTGDIGPKRMLPHDDILKKSLQVLKSAITVKLGENWSVVNPNSTGGYSETSSGRGQVTNENGVVIYNGDNMPSGYAGIHNHPLGTIKRSGVGVISFDVNKPSPNDDALKAGFVYWITVGKDGAVDDERRFEEQGDTRDESIKIEQGSDSYNISPYDAARMTNNDRGNNGVSYDDAQKK